MIYTRDEIKAKVKAVADDFALALEVGIDTTGGIEALETAKLMAGIQPVSSEELEAFHSALKECDKNSKRVIIDVIDTEENER